MLFANFANVFNKTIFESSKSDLLEKVADNPKRYLGLFRPTKPKAKILQNLLQSHEIRFGDAFEKIIELYLIENGCTILPKKIKSSKSDDLALDQCFRYNNAVYLVEQKMRDDHDSTKKKGQVKNFEEKLHALQKLYPKDTIVGLFFFVDDSLKKNKKYYDEEFAKIKADYGIETQNFYGEPFFTYLNMSNVWVEILDYLKKWRTTIPDLPEINFDLDASTTFEEIKSLSPATFRKLFTDKELFNEIVLTLFPTKATLNLLLAHFNAQSDKIYRTLFAQLELLLK